MAVVPERLRDERLRFNLVRKAEKRAFEFKWESDANYPWNHPKFQTHISSGGNYGVVCGPNNGRLCIIDADHAEVQEAVEAELPETFMVKSCHGYHYYYFVEDDMLTMVLDNPDNPGENWGHAQWDRRYCVGPTSVHPDGIIYEVYKDVPIATVKAEQIFYAVGAFHHSKEVQSSATDERNEATKYGNHDDIPIASLISLAGFQKTRDGYQGPHPQHGSEGGMNFKIDTLNNRWTCYRHLHHGGGPYQLIAVLEGILDCSEVGPGCLRGEKFIEVLNIAKSKYGVGLGVSKKQEAMAKVEEKYVEPETPPKELIDRKWALNSKGKLVAKRTADVAMAENHFLYTIDNGLMWIYEDGIYHNMGEDRLHEWCFKTYPEQMSKKMFGEVVAHVKANTMIRLSEFNQPWNLLVLQNGLYDILTGEFTEHNPSAKFTAKMPVIYNPEADCPRIKKFFSEVLCPEDITRIQEVFGYILYRRYSVQKAFLFIGPGGNGKGVTMNLMVALVGAANRSSRTMKAFEKNNFSVGDLYGMMINIGGEMPRSIKDGDIFKKLTGEEDVTGESKYQKAFTFRNYAKLVFSTNEMPEPPEDTNAWMRRWEFFNYPNSFEGASDNKNLINELTTPEELSGLFEWALIGLKRLLEQKVFSGSHTIEDTREKWIKLSNPLSAFVEEWIVSGKESDIIPKPELYKRFCDYCLKEGLPVWTNKKVGTKMKDCIPGIQMAQKRINNKTTWCWFGVRFRDAPMKVADEGLLGFTDAVVKDGELGEKQEPVRRANDFSQFDDEPMRSDPDDEDNW